MGERTRAATLPMRAVTRLTGLSADTLRAWERRHGAVAPSRTGGNARRYDDAHVARLRLLRAAVERGHPIGALVSLSDEALVELGRGPPSPAHEAIGRAIETYLACVERLDAAGAASVLALAAAGLEPRTLALELLAPLMREVGERWHAGALSVAAEHLATAQVRALVGDLEPELPPGAPIVLMAAPEGHLHDVGLAIGALLVAAHGARPIFLGANVPVAELGPAARRSRAALVVVACARDVEPREARALRSGLEALGSAHELWLGLPERHPLAAVRGARALSSLADFEAALGARFPSLPGEAPGPAEGRRATTARRRRTAR